MKSINQVAQEEGDSSANEANRIRERQALVQKTWRTVAYNEGESACTVARITTDSGLPEEYVRLVCGMYGLDLQ